MIRTPDSLDAGKTRLQILPPARHDDHAFAGVITRSPQEIILMAADRTRQAVLRTEEVDGAGLPVILSEDRGPRADVRRKIVVNPRDLRRHFLPAELVGEELR